MNQFKAVIFSLDPKISKVIESRLLSFDFKVFILKNILYFLSDISDLRPDIIFIDDSIFLNNFFSLKHIINKFRFLSNIPIIFLTKDPTFLNEFFIKSSFQINYFILKPFSIIKFDEKIDYILGTNFDSFLRLNPYSNVSFYLKNKSFKFKNFEIYLTKSEFFIFSLQLSQKNEISKRSLFLDIIWGFDSLNDDLLWSFRSNCLEMLFLSLKKKLRSFFKSYQFLRKRKKNYIFHF